MYTETNFLEQEFEPSKTMVVKWPENYELPSGSYNALRSKQLESVGLEQPRRKWPKEKASSSLKAIKNDP